MKGIVREKKHMRVEYKDFIKVVSVNDIVQKVLLTEDEDITVLWTIIDAPPFEDLLRMPIYEAQVQLQSRLRREVLLNFEVLNLSELCEGRGLDSILPVHTKLLWKRGKVDHKYYGK